MEEDIFKSVEEDLAEAIQELPPQAEPSRQQDAPLPKKSKKISEKSDDTEKEKDELQIEESRTENSKRRSDRPKVAQKTVTETAKDTKQSSKKTGEVKLPRLAKIEKIEARVEGEEDPLAAITLNRCLIVATAIVLLTMGVQVITGVFELDDEADSILSYAGNGLPDNDDLTLDVRTTSDDRGLVSGTEKVADHEKQVPFSAQARTDARKHHERQKDEAARGKLSPQARDTKVPKGSFKPKDSSSKPGAGREPKHKADKRDDKYFKKEHKAEKHRGQKEQHFKDGEDKKPYKGKVDAARDKGGKFNHSFPRKYEKNAKQDTYRKQQGQAKDFEKHKPFGKGKPHGDNVSRRHDYKGHKEYSSNHDNNDSSSNKQQQEPSAGPVRADERQGLESSYKKAGVPKHGGKNKFTESKRHD